MINTVEIDKYLTESDIAKAEEAEYNYTQEVGEFYMMDPGEQHEASEIYWDSIRATLDSKNIGLRFTIYSDMYGAEETVYDLDEAEDIVEQYRLDNPEVEYTIAATPLFYR